MKERSDTINPQSKIQNLKLTKFTGSPWVRRVTLAKPTLQDNTADADRLISALKTEASISKTEAAKVVQVFFDSMAQAMARGERVEIRGLCSFFVKNYKSYTDRNPKTGQKVLIEPKKLPFFKAGKERKERVDG